MMSDRRHWWWSWLRGYLIVVGVAAHVAAVGGVFFALRYFELTPRQAVSIALKKAGIEDGFLQDLIRPTPQFAARELDGRLRSSRPRVLLTRVPGGEIADRASWLQARLKRYPGKSVPSPCSGGGVISVAACWQFSGNPEIARKAIRQMRTFTLLTPNASGQYGNGWRLALAYDLLDAYPGFDREDRDLVERKIREALLNDLLLLDGDSASLWHGRATLASEALISAVVLGDEQLLIRAQGHFLDLIRAMEITGAWPEGYNYWINNRAFVVALAGAAFLNGLEQTKNAPRVRAALKRIAYWNLYGTRPDDRMAPLGDEGPRVDLKDETRRVIDLIAQLTRDRLLVSYSRYLARLHGVESYYRGYRWWFQLLNDPELAPAPGIADGRLQGLSRYLDKATLFGPRGLDLAFIRSGWGGDDTFISFRAGKSFTQHGHYDAGHFTLFKGAPLAITSGTYGGFFSDHRLNYSIRTVAKNSLLVLRPGERVKPNRHFKKNVAAGGQRITLPTGSAITSTSDWAENLRTGKYLDAGSIQAFDHRKGRYTYLSSDLTRAYNTPEHDEGGRGGKVEEATRELIYLEAEDRLIIHDKITSVEAGYTKKWLLHSVTRPQIEGLRVLVGSQDNGILESDERQIRVANGRGRLLIDVLLPADGVVRLVGGKDYRFYVESDGDDFDLDGENMVAGAKFQPWFDTGMWRIELQSREAVKRQHFLVALSPSVEHFRQEGEVAPLDIEQGEAWGVETPDSIVIFAGDGLPLSIRFTRRHQGRQILYLIGMGDYREVIVTMGGTRKRIRSNRNGVVVVDIAPEDRGRIMVEPAPLSGEKGELGD